MSMLTLHAYGTWLPDKPEGYWHHTDGMRPQSLDEAEQYRVRQRQRLVTFTHAYQRFMIQEVLSAAEPLQIKPVCFGSASTHLHAIVKWQAGRCDEQIREAIKQTLTRRLNAQFGRRTWFVRKFWCQEVESEEHLADLATEYLPGHPGWFWSRRKGWREPVAR